MTKYEFEDKINRAYCDFLAHAAGLRDKAENRLWNRLITVVILFVLSCVSLMVNTGPMR